MLAYPNAGFVNSETHDVGPPADREHHLVRRDRAPVGETHIKFIARLLDGGDGVAAGHGDAVGAHLVAQMLAHVIIEAAQDVFAAIDEGHLRAEARKDAGELDRDIAAALDDDARRQFIEMQRLVRRDHVLEAGNLRPVMRPGAGRDQDRLRLHARSGREQMHRVRVFQNGAALHQRNLVALERRGIRRFQPCDFQVFVGDQRRPTERRLLDVPAVTGRVFKFVAEARSVDQKLLRHAAADHAGAADAEFLRDHHACTVGRSDARGAHAARTRSDNEQIDFSLAHAPSP